MHAFEPGELAADRFRIIRFAGEGGMGEVYEAQDEQLRERIAVKVLRPALVTEARYRERFHEEVRLARRVSHPNVCRVFDLEQAYSKQLGVPVDILTMELLDGETLSKRLDREGPLPLDTALEIVRQLSAGLETAHEAGIVHRDFKCGNVMLCTDAAGRLRAVITDFGLARLNPEPQATGDSTGSGAGTPAYMAPEQILGQMAGPGVDIYAFGVILYEMTTGRKPFSDASPLAMAARKVAEKAGSPRNFRPDLPRAWDDVILRCLELRPEDRFATASALLAALESRNAMPSWLVRGRPSTVVALLTIAFVAGGAWAWNLRGARVAENARKDFESGTAALHEASPVRARLLLERALKADAHYPALRARLAEAYLELDMADRAKDQLLAVAAANVAITSADRILVDAVQATLLRDFQHAAEFYQQRVESEPAGPARSRSLLDLGRLHEKAAATPKAVATYERAVREDAANAAAHLRLGIMEGRRQKLDRASLEFDEAARLFAAQGNAEAAAETCLQRARALRNAQRISDSLREVDKALQLAQSGGNRTLEVRALFEKSLLQLRGGQFADAETHASRGLALARSEGLETLSLQGLIDLGSAALTQYKVKEAATFLQQALQIADRLNSPTNRARAQTTLASARLRSGRVQDAFPLLADALRFYRENEFKNETLTGLTLLADAHYDGGGLAESERYAVELGELARKGGDTLSEAVSFERIARIRAARGEIAPCDSGYESAANLHRRAGREVNAVYATVNRGACFLAAMQFAKAESVWRALKTEEPQVIERLNLLRAEAALAHGRFSDAHQYAAKALESARKGAGPRQAFALRLLSEASLAQNQLSEARRQFAEAEGLGRNASLPILGIPLALTQVRLLAANDETQARDKAASVLDATEAHGLTVAAAEAASLLYALDPKQKPAWERARDRLRPIWTTAAIDEFHRQHTLRLRQIRREKQKQ